MEQWLAEDDILAAEEVTIAVALKAYEQIEPALRTLRESIQVYRQGAPLDVDALMDDIRDERDEGILGLR